MIYKQLKDQDLPRNRRSRAGFFFATLTGLPVLGMMLGHYLAGQFFEFQASQTIGLVVGTLGGLVGFLASLPHLLVRNSTTGGLVTLDTLQSLFGKGNVHVVYGPGTHFCFPWERRFAENNIPVLEAAEEFTFDVMCRDGVLEATGSFRLRPNLERAIEFLSGVAAVAGDTKDIIVTRAVEFYKERSLREATATLAALNSELAKSFSRGETDFEARFGVQVGDVTVSKVLPKSEELRRTINALAEAELAFEGAAILLGMSTADLKLAIANKAIDQKLVDDALRTFMVTSGNIAQAATTRFEIDIKGLTPEAAEAVTALASRLPPGALNQLAKGSKPSAPKGGK